MSFRHTGNEHETDTDQHRPFRLGFQLSIFCSCGNNGEATTTMTVAAAFMLLTLRFDLHGVFTVFGCFGATLLDMHIFRAGLCARVLFRKKIPHRVIACDAQRTWDSIYISLSEMGEFIAP
jgi:hypothetical protein